VTGWSTVPPALRPSMPTLIHLAIDLVLIAPSAFFRDRESFCPRKGDKILRDHENPGPAPLT
jgi:hypothetical protein